MFGMLGVREAPRQAGLGTRPAIRVGMTSPPTDNDENKQANERAAQLRKERAIAARIWLEKAIRALETERPIEGPM